MVLTVNKIELKEKTQKEIGNFFTSLAYKGYDVQEFDPDALYGGTKKSLATQKGYYKSYNHKSIKQLGFSLSHILNRNQEYDVLNYFEQCKKLFNSSQKLSSHVKFFHAKVIKLLPNSFFDSINPADMVAPNGLRIPETITQLEDIRKYSAKLLVPKLLLAAIADLQDKVPWTDSDMDLSSTVHAMRPDPDKHNVSSGYGGGAILPHTDGYWNELNNVPLFVNVLGIANPLKEPTAFIPVEEIFRIPLSHHSKYNTWREIFSDLVKPGQKPEDFVRWIIKEALKPQFSFVMGRIGGDARRAVHNTPLLEKDLFSGTYIFRAKSTFYSKNEQVFSVIDFVNRMIKYLSEMKTQNNYAEIALEPGELYIALNGSGLKVNLEQPILKDNCFYPVWGFGTVHGRDKLTEANRIINRTLVRGNSLKDNMLNHKRTKNTYLNLIDKSTLEHSDLSFFYSVTNNNFYYNHAGNCIKR